ncbi:MAG: nitrogenase component 1 [Lachnospiraceae bacterium]|nr:nitrogenase component 1 [Lachnospiraceae bacterium]
MGGRKEKGAHMQPFFMTAKEIVERGSGDFPHEFSPADSLILSSPATLSYTSPGANGYGVKRAGLVLPESVMLLISPGCCGRNSTILSRVSGYSERMFYLTLTEKDLVTGRYLKKIPDACVEIADVYRERSGKMPRVIVLCITCVDALLGTDLERVARKCEKALHQVLETEGDRTENALAGRAPEESMFIRVVPSYMYALTREGTRPPMTAIRKTLYSLLERKPVNPRAVNILGNFAHLSDDCELYDLFQKAGLAQIREIGRMKSLDDYMQMGEANFNLVLNPEAVYAAEDLATRLQMPYVTMTRLYDPTKIARQYQLLGAAIGVRFDDAPYRKEAEEKKKNFLERHPRLRVVLGQMLNANPFELAANLVAWGWLVPEIFAAPSEPDLPFLKELAAISPDTKIYSSSHPTMAAFRPVRGRGTTGDSSGSPSQVSISRDGSSQVESTAPSPLPQPGQSNENRPWWIHEGEATRIVPDGSAQEVPLEPSPMVPPDLTLGKDAAYYYPGVPNVPWSDDIQPFGYRGLIALLDACDAVL